MTLTLPGSSLRSRRFVPRFLAGLAALAASGVLAAAALATVPPTLARLSWHGQSCFVLESPEGTRIVMDPIPKGLGYELPQGLRAEAVTISHEHFDHNNVGLVAGKPKVLRGLTADKKGWIRIDEKVKDITVRSVGVYHDESKGAERGLNTVFLFELAGGLRVAHLGDLGHLLTDSQLAAIGNVDVALVPVGGTFTIDAKVATQVIEQLRPRLVVVPMHYKTDVLSKDLPLAPVDEFLKGKKIRREKGNTLALSGLKSGPSAEVVVLGYK